MEEMRIQKYISQCGLMSRRAAEQAVADGRIYINGKKAVTGQAVIPEIDEVVCDGINVGTVANKTLYIMLYKPSGIVTTMSDEKGRKCIKDILTDIDERVYPIGRLDMYSEGLLLLTNDGEVSNKIMHPSHNIIKIYHVKIKGELEQDIVRKISAPIEIDGKMTSPAEVSIIERKNGITNLRIILHEGRNRQIRNICDNLRLVILKLKRISIGNINIGTLRPGQWKHLNRSEVEYLKKL